MKHKRKPHLAGIHEFSAVAYVKGLKAGNLDVYTILRHFVGYDSESKGFSIYWPRAQSVTVEENVVFNDSDATVNATAVIPSDLSEGEKEKIIQILKNNTRHTEANVIENPPNKCHIENNFNPSVDPKPQTTIPLPYAPDISTGTHCK